MERMTATEPLLTVRGLDIAFASGKKLTPRTDGVHFEVRPGEILSLVGESGCGKSITALSLLGLLGRQGRVTGGEVLFKGRDLLKMTEKQLDEIRGREIAMIFQDITYSLNPVFTIGSQLTETLRRHRGMSSADACRRAVELLEKTGIPHPQEVMKKYPHMLSGGMRQRVMIAMALTCDPCLLIADEPTTALDVTIQLQIMQLLKKLRDETGMAILMITHDIGLVDPCLLIADEPTTALDVTIQLQIMQLLKKLRDETGMAILMITHDIGLVTEMADRVVVMYAGQCVEEASTQQLLETPQHPYTQALLRAVPGLHDPRERRLYAIPGTVPEEYQALTGCRFAPRCPYGAQCPGTARETEIAPGHRVRCCRAEEGCDADAT